MNKWVYSILKVQRHRLFFVFISLFFVAVIPAATYHVDAINGFDTYNGLSPVTAWKSLSKINNSIFLPGDSILFKRGGVWLGNMNIDESGSSGNRIVFTTYGTGNRPIIDGGAMNETMILSESDYITFSGLEIRGGIYSCVLVSGTNYLIIDNSVIGWGALGCGIQVTGKYSSRTGSNYGIIKNSQFDSGLRGSVGDIGSSDGIMLIDGGNNWEIHDNHLRGWAHTAIAIKQGNTTFETAYNKIHHNDIDGNYVNYNRAFEFYGEDNKSHHNEFYQNYIHGVTVTSHVDGNNNSVYYNIFDSIRNPDSRTDAHAMDLTIYVNTASGSENMVCHHNKISNNVIFNCTVAGINVIGTVNGADSLVHANEITNNILYNCAEGIRVLNLGGTNISSGPNIYRNNLIYHTSSTNIIYYRGSMTNASGFNAFNGSNGDLMSNNIQADPLFTNISQGLFNLNGGSPAINAGWNIGLTSDYDGNIVPQGSGPDIGAYEFGISNSIDKLILGKDFFAFPNPSNGNMYIKLNGLKNEEQVLVAFINVLGQTVFSKIIFSDTSGNVREEIGSSQILAAGVYNCICSTKDKMYKQQIVVK